jgi:ubiquinone/menaquinone biosynthesis C-methylase UbiE
MVYKTIFPLVYEKFVDRMLRDLRDYTPGFAGMKAGDRVLDVCCGTGDQALHYAASGIESVGIDNKPAMIRVACKNMRKRGLSNASFQVADASNLPFRDSSFDIVSISLALHEKERPARDEVISEMKRVVKRGGTLVFIDLNVPLPRSIYGFGVRVVEFIAGWNHFRCSRDYIRQGGLDVLLAKHGLREEKTDYIKFGLIVVIQVRQV